tara:strand:+ start:258 stop:1259 length:1002 start_codon:yes stop_codon:yes gene_type:complete
MRFTIFTFYKKDMSQQICLISYDHWNYDFHIVNELRNQGHISHHIKISGYKHAHFKDRISNTLSKLFLGKNLKKIRRQEAILKRLDDLGFQDQILVINPEVIDLEFHLKIKKRCTTYIAYLYDSVKRNPVDHLLEGLFDKVYSFDKDDIETYQLKPANNYIYLPYQTINKSPKFDVVYVGSLDERLSDLLKIAKHLKKLNINYKFVVIGKRKVFEALKMNNLDLITFEDKRKSQMELLEFYKCSHTILDLIRPEQTGLSFRFFEALPLQKKIITNNIHVSTYDFHNPENIHIVKNTNHLNISESFFKSPYKELPKNIYKKYTLNHWVQMVFNL